MNPDTGELKKLDPKLFKKLEEQFIEILEEHQQEAEDRLNYFTRDALMSGQEETEKGDVHLNWLDKKSGLTKWGHKKRKIRDRMKRKKV